MTPAEVVRDYAAGRRDFLGVEVESEGGASRPRGPEFRGAVLDGVDFSQAFIVATFDGVRRDGRGLPGVAAENGPPARGGHMSSAAERDHMWRA